MEIIIKRFEELSVEELYGILKARVDVFVAEQKCPYPDLDDKDKKAYHIFLTEENKIKAYLRLLDKGVSFEDVSIGRVLTTERGKGYSKIIIEAAINIAKEKMNADRIIIEAQSYTQKLYEKFGFRQTSEEFMEDWIPHIQMTLDFERKNKK